MKRYRLLIFDFDGTLVHTLPDIAYYANAVLKKFGCRDRSVTEVQKAIGWGVHELFMSLVPELKNQQGKLDKMVDLFKRDYAERPVYLSHAYEKVTEVLGGPLRRAKKAVITNKPQDITIRILEQLSLMSCFDLVIGGGAGYPLKPDPFSTLFVMKKLKAKRSETVLIGDSGVDFETAKNAGIDFVWMFHGYDDSLKSKNGIRKMKSPDQWKALNR